MPEIFRIFGLRFFFYSDEHLPIMYMFRKEMVKQDLKLQHAKLY